MDSFFLTPKLKDENEQSNCDDDSLGKRRLESERASVYQSEFLIKRRMKYLSFA